MAARFEAHAATATASRAAASQQRRAALCSAAAAARRLAPQRTPATAHARTERTPALRLRPAHAGRTAALARQRRVRAAGGGGVSPLIVCSSHLWICALVDRSFAPVPSARRARAGAPPAAPRRCHAGAAALCGWRAPVRLALLTRRCTRAAATAARPASLSGDAAAFALGGVHELNSMAVCLSCDEQCATHLLAHSRACCADAAAAGGPGARGLRQARGRRHAHGATARAAAPAALAFCAAASASAARVACDCAPLAHAAGGGAVAPAGRGQRGDDAACWRPRRRAQRTRFSAAAAAARRGAAAGALHADGLRAAA